MLIYHFNTKPWFILCFAVTLSVFCFFLQLSYLYMLCYVVVYYFGERASSAFAEVSDILATHFPHSKQNILWLKCILVSWGYCWWRN